MQDAEGHADCILMDSSGYRTGFVILRTMDIFGHIIHSPGGLSSALQVLSIQYLYSLPTPWLPFPSGQSRMTQHIASSPLGGKSHLWLGNSLKLFSFLNPERSGSGVQYFCYFSMQIIFHSDCDLFWKGIQKCVLKHLNIGTFQLPGDWFPDQWQREQ